MNEHYLTHSINNRSFGARLAFGILLGITFLAPIFFAPVSFLSTQFATSLLFAFGVILALIVYGASVLSSGNIDLPKPARYILGFTSLVPLVYLMAGISNGFSRMSFFGYTFDINTVGFMLLGFIYLFLVSVLFINRKNIFYSYIAVVFSSILLALFLLVRLVFGVETLSFGIFNDITSTPVGSWNNVGIFFGIGLLLSVLTYEMVHVSKIVKWLLVLSTILSLFFLALVGFSFVWWAMAVCSLVFVLYVAFTHSHHELSFFAKLKNAPKFSAFIFVVSLVFVIWGSSIAGYLNEKFNVVNVDVRPSLSVTMDIAKHTIAEKPLFGSGPTTFTFQWLTWRPTDIVSTVFWNTDFSSGMGLLPTFAVTTGILGILSWILFLGFYIYLGVKSIFARIEDGFVKYLLTSSFFVSLYLWIMAFVYIPSTSVFIMTLFFTGVFFSSVYLSGIIKIENKVFGDHPKTGFVATLLLVATLLGVVVLGFGVLKNAKSLWYFDKGLQTLNNSTDIALGEEYMNKAIENVPHDIYYRVMSEIGVAKMTNLLNTTDTNVKPEEIQKQFSDTLSATIIHGLSAKNADDKNYLNWIALGKVYESVSLPELKIEGAYESAQFAYGEALKRNPTNPGILILFSRLAMVKNDIAEARRYAEEAIKTKNNYVDAYFLLSQIEVADKNLKRAIESVTAASVIDPTNAGIFFQLGLLKYNDKDFAGAIESLLKAVEISPDYANAKYFLGLSYDEVGETEKALKEFEDIAKTNPDNQDLVKIIENIKSGQKALTGLEETNPESAEGLPVEDTE
ncbi:MAG: tetratricopeptide repeat protein [Patescibacteria group bacterium]